MAEVEDGRGGGWKLGERDWVAVGEGGFAGGKGNYNKAEDERDFEGENCLRKCNFLSALIIVNIKKHNCSKLSI